MERFQQSKAQTNKSKRLAHKFLNIRKKSIMFKYKISHGNGVFQIEVLASESTLSAQIVDENLATIATLAVSNEEELFYNCRNWASSNIVGEFLFEEVP
jgi:hypothetical protein